MWFTKSEPESFLQHELEIPGNVATEHPRDLLEPDDQLCQPNDRATEIEVSKRHAWEGAHILAHQG